MKGDSSRLNWTGGQLHPSLRRVLYLSVLPNPSLQATRAG
jgi:hypothetical protein